MEMTLILGALQGFFEWLPVSSEGIVVLAQIHLFGATSLSGSISLALYLHLGTVLAAIVYFRKDIWQLIAQCWRGAGDRYLRTLTQFILIATAVSAPIAYVLLLLVERAEESFAFSGTIVTACIAVLLLGTGILLLRKENTVQQKTVTESRMRDGIYAGIAQGLAVLPGFSRSGLTTAVLLLRKFNGVAALKMSFLMSIPLVLGGVVVLQLREATFGMAELAGAFAAFVVGLATIHLLLALARRIHFGIFVIFFAILVLVSLFI